MEERTVVFNDVPDEFSGHLRHYKKRFKKEAYYSDIWTIISENINRTDKPTSRYNKLTI